MNTILCLTKDGKRIETASCRDETPEVLEKRLESLKQNAIKSGYLESNIEVKLVTDAEYAAAKAEDPNEIARIAEMAAKEAIQAAKAQEIIDNLPAWQTVSNALDDIKADAQAATTIAALKAVVIGLIFFIKKLTRVVYILAREQ